MTRHLVGLHHSAAAGQLINKYYYRLLRVAALHHAAVNISFTIHSEKYKI